MATTPIAEYNAHQSESSKAICELLAAEIDATLIDASSKLFHANPVWFLNDNPIVGYDVADDHVNVLFWSGQDFTTPGLSAAGKFKAAGIKYASINDIQIETLRSWLKESIETQWNYRDLRQNNGELLPF